ncbi:MAG: ParB-like nuclease domain [Deltaproteobacteria bacterium]|nr:ParB-like nuclease domain [Deltaproteobacteria bacterium]
MTQVPLSRIDLKDGRFSLSYGRDNANLRSSIDAVGIIEPVILLDQKSYIPVAGLRRLHCARALRIRSVPAIIVAISEQEALLKAIHTNIERGYNIIEKASVLYKMHRLGFPRPDILALMRYLDLNPHEKILEIFIAIAGLEIVYKQFIFTHNVSLRNIESFLRFDMPERRRIVRSLAGFHLTESTLREIFEMLHILRIRKGKLTGRDIPVLPNAESLRAYLKERTHPILTSLTRKLKAIRDTMPMPRGIDIRVDPFFEKEYIDLVLRIKDYDDLRTALAKISGLADAGYLRSILELTKGTIR